MHFHFTGWPDHGVPKYPTSLLSLIKLVRSHHEKFDERSPAVVHCRYNTADTVIVILQLTCSHCTTALESDELEHSLLWITP